MFWIGLAGELYGGVAYLPLVLLKGGQRPVHDDSRGSRNHDTPNWDLPSGPPRNFTAVINAPKRHLEVWAGYTEDVVVRTGI